jgi:oligoribonuclease NrnB/cAMP/cGMP phosphodiesterase (DHH superfamily)
MTGDGKADGWRPDICIYHGHCSDGFGAALAVWKRWGDAVRYVPMQYGQSLSDVADVAGKHVLMVDFSLKRPATIEAAKIAASIVVLDHHKTAQEELRGFLELPSGRIGWSLRSENSRSDVGSVANRFGGGGHRNASGFSVAVRPEALRVGPDGKAIEMAP